MALESATYISELVDTNPAVSDPVGQGDDHLKMIKTVLKTQFSGLAGTTAITTDESEMNLLDGGYEGTAVVSTGESGGTKFLREDGDATCSWQVPPDTDTTYTAGDGLDLTGTTFSTDLKANGGLDIDSTELSVAQGISQYDVAQFTTGVVDDDFLRIDGTAVEGRSAAEVLSDIAALPLAGGTMSGTIAAADQLITRPRFTDYSETLNAIGDTGGGSDTIDIESGNVVSATVSTAEQTFVFSNPSATGKSCSFTLLLTNGGSQTVNWPAEVDWAGGSAPDLTSSGVDALTFTTIDEGTIWYGFAAGLDMG
jgi:hypothetical protein